MWLTVLAGVTAALTIVNGGVFFAFSTFIVPAARRVPALEALHLFQAMNRVVPRSLYLPVFLLSGLGGAALAVAAVVAGGSGWFVAGGATAFVALLVSFAVNIPRNNALDRVAEANASTGWQEFIGGWAIGNHVRALLCVVATGLLVVGFLPG